MVDKQELVEQLKKLKKQIQNDPKVRAIYDLDGDGNISGEEWEKARKTMIAFLEAKEARQKAQSKTAGAVSMAAAGAGGAAEQVFSRIKNNVSESASPSKGTLFDQSEIVVQQQVENLELFTSLEGRNKYKFLSTDGRELAMAAESDTGMFGTLTRSFFSNSRPFVMGINIYNSPESVILKRQFEFIFSKLEVQDDEAPIGMVRQKFAILNRKYELEPYLGKRTLTILGPIFKPWTFNVMIGQRQVGTIKKKWSGFLKEAFTKADTFIVSYEYPNLTIDEKKMILGAAIAIDIDHFEQKKNNSSMR